ncbi:hypothetical protein [Bifidobacterium miconisargentati]|uniref:hypothetical protein n=1 Tax=Bifidobacterium miconisargentati TaxID=2834437 RepID=UPI001BDD245E|nr:hypothetical protein [Bifidobacterium miconisargentati]MBW3089587.1 hypothetical protein [Bifidobacterium miconisargentati]
MHENEPPQLTLNHTPGYCTPPLPYDAIINDDCARTLFLTDLDEWGMTFEATMADNEPDAPVLSFTVSAPPEGTTIEDDRLKALANRAGLLADWLADCALTARHISAMHPEAHISADMTAEANRTTAGAGAYGTRPEGRMREWFGGTLALYASILEPMGLRFAVALDGSVNRVVCTLGFTDNIREFADLDDMAGCIRCCREELAAWLHECMNVLRDCRAEYPPAK